MTILFLLVAALLGLTAAVYVQVRLPRYTASAGAVWFSRCLLGLVGMGLGWAWSRNLPEPLPAALAFLIGCGLVHVPAAAILFLKRARRSSPS